MFFQSGRGKIAVYSLVLKTDRICIYIYVSIKGYYRSVMYIHIYVSIKGYISVSVITFLFNFIKGRNKFYS